MQGSVARGLAYAQETCAPCHAVGGSQRLSPNPKAHSFDAIANTPGMTATALNAWLHTSHPTMPNFILDPNRIDDLSAYIATLKRRSSD
jgi:mono/diheme cytochrome c family protein